MIREFRELRELQYEHNRRVSECVRLKLLKVDMLNEFSVQLGGLVASIKRIRDSEVRGYIVGMMKEMVSEVEKW